MIEFLNKILYKEINQKILNFVKKNYLTDSSGQLYWYIFFNLEEEFPHFHISPDWNNTIILIEDDNNNKYNIEFLNLNNIKLISNKVEINFSDLPDIFN